MRVVHSFGSLNAGKNIKEDASFILTNKIGGYCLLAGSPSSRYQGVFFNDHFKMYKAIEDIRVIGCEVSKVKELKNNFFNVERKRNSITESFFMPYGFDSFVYELSKEGNVELVLDIRETYSNPEFGRSYDIFEENGKIIVKYRQENEFECYLVVSGYSSYEKTQNWLMRNYDADRQRNSPPYSKYVFSALKIRSKKLVFSFSFDKEKAIKENTFVFDNLEKLKCKQEMDIRKIINRNNGVLGKIKNNETKIAYICALISLNNMAVNINGIDGIFAGLPWFFQFWERDEAITLKALSCVGKREAVRNILARLVGSIKGNKAANKYPEGDLYSSDAAGWILHRVNKLEKGLLKSREAENILKNLDDNLVFNGKKETWMDSIDRDGARIEMQALKLAMLKSNKGMENKFRNKVRESFWNNKFLRDGIYDETIRPNIFIAAYLYPELLSKEEWLQCFEYAIERLWLEWGGLSTIDKNNHLFYGKHTGENPKSYHNGDSWFYLNNLAALVLYRADKKKFGRYIKKILDASTNEILWKGAIGHHAEISSASVLSSEGCLSQAWSSAMFIELIDELKFKKNLNTRIIS